jgi:carboxyl-terminal processing protease
LQLSAYQQEMKQIEQDNKRYDELIKSVKAMSVVSTSTDDAQVKGDANKSKIKIDWNKSFEKDIYLQEAVKVLQDLN